MKSGKAKVAVPHKDWLMGYLKDPGHAAAYLDAAIGEGDPVGLMQALRNVAEARGGVAKIADRTGLSRETLYRTLSRRGNPQLKSLTAILAATGLMLSVKPAVASRVKKAAGVVRAHRARAKTADERRQGA